MMNVDIMELNQRHQTLLGQRRPWEEAWQDLANHFLPTRYRQSNKDYKQNPLLLNDKVYDSTGILAMRTLAAGLQGGMTSPARPWFRLNLEDQDMAQYHGVKEYMDEVARRMRSIFHRSNFYNAMHSLYGELGTFGTAFMLEIADFQNGFRFIPFTAGEYCLDINEVQKTDVVFRSFQISPRQALRMFGENKLPDYIVNMVNKNTNGSVQVAQGIYPRTDRIHGKMTPENKAWASVWWLEEGNIGSGMKPTILREHGFDEFPGFGVRWDLSSNDTYGRSPAMDVLPDCRMLQQMALTTLKAIHKTIDPPMSVSASLKSVGLDLTPGGANYVENMPGQAPQAAVPIMQIRPEIQAARLAMADVQKQIQSGLYNDLFRMLMGSNRAQITATEIAAREEEKLILIGPVLERLHDELFIPLIDRTYNLMSRMDMLPQAPPELSGTEIKVEFTSLLAQAQKLVSTSAVDQLLSFTMNSAKAFPEVLDAVDIDNIMDGYAEYLGVEVDMIRPKQDREALRQERIQAQAQAAQQQAAIHAMDSLKNLAGTAKTMSETSSGNTNALSALTGLGSK